MSAVSDREAANGMEGDWESVRARVVRKSEKKMYGSRTG